jgi:aspartyl protease family protein
MVDTGASLVAINETTARRIGVSIASLDFKYPISTANGETRAAHIRLQRVEIGSVRVEDVDAFVLRDKALSGTLIGMSFLKRLGAYSAEGDRLRLER